MVLLFRFGPHLLQTGCLWQLKSISQRYTDPKQHNLVKLNFSLSTFQCYNWNYFRLSTDIWRAVDTVFPFPISCLTRVVFFIFIITIVDSQGHNLRHKSLWERNSQLIWACCTHHVSHQMTLHRKEQILSLFDIKSITGVFVISFSVAHYLLRASLCLCSPSVSSHFLYFYIKALVRQ